MERDNKAGLEGLAKYEAEVGRDGTPFMDQSAAGEYVKLADVRALLEQQDHVMPPTRGTDGQLDALHAESRNIEQMMRTSDQTLQLRFMSVRSCSAFLSALGAVKRAAIFGANEPAGAARQGGNTSEASAILQRPENVGKPVTLEDYRYSVPASQPENGN